MNKPTNMPKTFFFEDKPLFGLDIGHGSLRVMELDTTARKLPRLKGYGTVVFDASAVVDGVIAKPEVIAKAANTLFHKHLVGDISTNRVAVSLPAQRAFTRATRLPKMSDKELAEAVRTEAEQYIPAAIDELYLDYTRLRDTDDGIELFIVAMPKKIVDSYLLLTRMLGLEAVLFETSIGASAQLFAHDKRSNIPSVLIDFGSGSTDITIFNRGLVATGTVALGSDHVTKVIEKALNVTPDEALVLKSKYGLGSSKIQKLIVKAVEPTLEALMKEIRRTIRYYEEHYPTDPPIGQVLTLGGGANMPGLADALTERLRLPVRAYDPGVYIDFAHFQPFYNADRMSYVTVAGLAVTNPAEIFT